MKFTPTTISEVILIQPKLYSDERGFFMETYQATRYSEAGIEDNFVQDNHSGSIQGTLRGMHYQIRHPQGKLVQIVTGEVYDVAVDLRRSSPTFGKWVGEKLSADNKLQLWIPPGFAHGFYVLSDWADVLYKVTEFYAPDWDRTLLWNDTALGIKWPLIDGILPLLSEKDANGTPLKNADTFA
jgi:dTDP-4-dehydrorhamnose 3,5-epimerase